MGHDDSGEDIEGQEYGHVRVHVNEESLVVEESDHDVDDVWYDVYDLSALGVPREGDDVEDGEVLHGQPTAQRNDDGHDDDDDDDDGVHAGQGDGDEDDQWNWGAVGEAGDVFYDSYGGQVIYEDAASEDYYNNRSIHSYDDDDDDDDLDRERDRVGNREMDGDGDSTDAALTRDTEASSNPRILSRARAFSIYFDKLAKLSDNDKQRDKIKFWAR